MKKISLSSFSNALRTYQHPGVKTIGGQFKAWEKIRSFIVLLPSGNGIDDGVKFCPDISTPTKLVFSFSYHHMNDSGYYDGWTNHNVIITPCFGESFDIKITGPNKNDCKDYFYDLFSDFFTD